MNQLPYNWRMGLYVVWNRGAGARREIWIPGDPGQPNYADTKEELLSSCPEPESLPCPGAGCDGLGTVYAHTSRGLWAWAKMSRCRRCQDLRNHHGMELADLIAIWEAQGRQCFKCSNPLPDPRIIVAGVRGRGREAKIDHDHRICPQASHSCSRCRRGLVCVRCNCHELSIRSGGWWVLPKGDDLRGWLEFLGPEDRDRLRQALTLFPEQPVRRVSRRQSRGEREPGEVIPLFDLGADSA